MKRLFINTCYCIILLSLSTMSFAEVGSQRVFTVGNMQVEMLIDEADEGDISILLGASPEMLAKYIPTGKYSKAITSALIRTPEGVILIDTGLGNKLAQYLAERKITPESVETILITHMHADHINGLMQEDKAFFPNAKIYIAEPEVNYWADYTNINKLPEEKRERAVGLFKNGQKILEAYKDRVITFIPGEITENGLALLPNIQALATYGHTPGHTVFLLNNQGEKLLVMGDIMNASIIQYPYPEVAVIYDVNPEQAIQSRKALFNYAATNNIPVAAMHQPKPEFNLIKPSPNKNEQYILKPL